MLRGELALRYLPHVHFVGGLIVVLYWSDWQLVCSVGELPRGFEGDLRLIQVLVLPAFDCLERHHYSSLLQLAGLVVVGICWCYRCCRFLLIGLD